MLKLRLLSVLNIDDVMPDASLMPNLHVVLSWAKF
jgi:hypothetical protein